MKAPTPASSQSIRIVLLILLVGFTVGLFWISDLGEGLANPGTTTPVAPPPAPSTPVVSSSLEGPQTTEIIVDDQSSGYSPGGPSSSWYHSGSSDTTYGGHAYWTYAAETWYGSDTNNWATWIPNLPQSGRYEVFVFIPVVHTDRPDTTRARYQVYTSSGSYTVEVDQGNNNRWASLGTFIFSVGTSGYVRLEDVTPDWSYQGQRKTILFDAVKWEYRGDGGTPPPPGGCQNLVINPSFESGSGDTPDGWDRFSGTAWTYTAHTGNRAAEAWNEFTTHRFKEDLLHLRGWRSEIINVTPGERYYFSYWNRKLSGEGSHALASVMTTNGRVIHELSMPTGSNWQTGEESFIVPNDVSLVWVDFYGAATGSGHIAYDDFWLATCPRSGEQPTTTPMPTATPVPTTSVPPTPLPTTPVPTTPVPTTPSPTGQVVGIVRNTNNQPIADATVSLGGEWEVQADAQGRYSISNVPQGPYTITGRAASYQERSYLIGVEAGRITEFDLVLSLDDPRQKLAERFAPILHMHSDDWLEEPKHVDVFVNDAQLINQSGNLFRHRGQATSQELATTFAGRLDYILDLPEDVTQTNPDVYRNHYEDLIENEKRYPSIAYASVKTHVTRNPTRYFTTIQYWFFYYFNDGPLNKHEGDWEQITLVFETPSPGLPDEDATPIRATYAQHAEVWPIMSGRESRPWSGANGLSTPKQGGHPEVFVARGSHASYFTSGQHQLQDETEWRFPAAQTKPDVVLIPDGSQPPSWGPVWLNFLGRWGQEVTVLGPFGPIVRRDQSGGPSLSDPSSDRFAFQDPLCWAMQDYDARLDEHCKPTEREAEEARVHAAQGAFVSKISGDAELHVYDATGHHLGPDGHGGIELDIPGSQLFDFGDWRVAYIEQADLVDRYTLRIVGSGTDSTRLIIAIPDVGDEMVQALQYFDVPNSAVMQGEVSLAPDSSFTLRIDLDGNGSYETEKWPDINKRIPLRGSKLYLPLVARNHDTDAQPKPPTGPVDKIIFSSARGGNLMDLYVMNDDGGNIRRLTNAPGYNELPRVSNDGKQAVFQSTRTGTYQAYIMNIDGSGARQLTPSCGESKEPNWSPDGARIVFVCDGYIAFVEPDGSQFVKTSVIGNGPDWSPDGTKLAFTRWVGSDGDWEIFVMNADGSHEERLTQTPLPEWLPAWSPDGSEIAFCYGGTEGQACPVYTMNADGSNRRWLADGGGSGYSSPNWSPDGQRLVFMSNRDGNEEIYVMNKNGTNQTRLTSNPANDHSPFWFTTGGLIMPTPTATPSRTPRPTITHTPRPTVTPIPTNTPTTVDQDNDPSTGTSFGCGTSGASLYQSFTPVRLPLTAVELRLRAGGSFPETGVNTTIKIRSDSPDGDVLGTATAFVPGTLEVGGQILVHFHLFPAIAVTPEETYVIEWLSPASAGVPAGTVLTWMGRSDNPYPKGNMFNCARIAVPTDDLNFRTFSNTRADTPRR